MQFNQLKRREFIALLSGATAAWPLAARAQQAPMPVIGFLSNGYQHSDEPLRLIPFREGLKEAGYIDGRNLVSEYRWAEDQYDRLPELADDLLRRHPAVIVALGGPASALAAKRATTTVPVVFVIAGDPVELGLVASFNRPGGNVTGVAIIPGTIVAKQFEALHETIPAATLIGCLLNSNNPLVEAQTREATEATHMLGRKLEVVHARNETEIERAFATLVQKGAGALVVVPDGFFNSRPEQFVGLAAQYRIPAIYSVHEFARAGGLMSYGFNNADGFRQAGVYTGRILKGEKPAELPVIQGTKVELVINVKTAETLGISFPLSLLGRADEVIE
jgi:putative tryptophan/tyrosine transport system substrate-binding protein